VGTTIGRSNDRPEVGELEPKTVFEGDGPPDTGPDRSPGTPFSIWIATVGGVGYAPLAPGTAGSAVGGVLFFVLAHLGLPLYVVTLIALGCLGIWAADCAEPYFGSEDDGRVVIDEVVGQLVTLLPLVALLSLPLGRWRLGELWGASPVGLEISVFYLLVVTGFVVFRVLDVWKPGPIRWAEGSFKGGMGVMADDVFAGGIGALVLTYPAYAVLISRLSAVLGGGQP
jgi:phosphatidylglycerophosphatase A